MDRTMNRFFLYKFISLSFLFLITNTLNAEERPNVIVLFADDMGYRDLSCYNGPVHTPTLDDLAAKGIKFTDFHSGAGVCSPSRATLMTGRHHYRTGVYHVINNSGHNMHLLDREVTIAEVLKSNGYTTAHIGKWHMGLPNKNKTFKPTPMQQGYDYWYGTDNNAEPNHKNPTNFMRNGKPVGPLKGYACQLLVDDTIRWLDKERDPQKPFFLNIWFHEPHSPIGAPDEIVTKYGKLNSPAAVYSGTIDNMDKAIGRLLDKIKAMGERQNTVVIFSSDNGSYRQERSGELRQGKGSLYEGGHRAPGIINWPPKIKGGRVEKTMAGMVDLLPTICGLTGVDKPKGIFLDGSDLTPLLIGDGEKFKRHQPLFWINAKSNPSAAIREGKYVLIGFRDFELKKNQKEMNRLTQEAKRILTEAGSPLVNDGDFKGKMYNSKFKVKEAEKLRIEFLKLNRFQESWIPAIKKGSYKKFALYDLERDISQKTDIAAKHPDVVKRLKKLLLNIQTSVMKEAPDF